MSKFKDFMLVNRNQSLLYNYLGPTNPQNILIGEACVDINGNAQRTFPHGFLDGDYVMSAYCDRIRGYIREVDGVLVSDTPVYAELNKKYQGKMHWDSWLMNANPSELIEWATELTDGRLGFCGKRPDGQKVTAVRVIRFTNVCSGYATYLILVVGVLDKHLKQVLDYTNPDVIKTFDRRYDVNEYGHLSQNQSYIHRDIHGDIHGGYYDESNGTFTYHGL